MSFTNQGRNYVSPIAMASNNQFKSFATLTGTASTARLFAHAFGIIVQTPLSTSCPLTKRYVQ